MDESKRISPEIGEVVGYFEKFGLMVNESKTNTVLFRASRAQIDVPTIRLGGSIVTHPKRSNGLVLLFTNAYHGFGHH